MEIKFVKLGINGEGIGYLNHKPVFCMGVFPNETAEVEILDKKNGYYTAEVKKMIWRSKERVKTNYPYYIEEGCPLFPMKYDAQLKYKRKLLIEALYKYAKVKEHFVREVKPSPLTLGYRNSCKLPVQESDHKLVSGMYVPRTNHFHPITHSLIQDPVLEEARVHVLKVLNQHHLHAYDERKKTGVRYICMRIVDQNIQCTLVTGKDEINQDVLEDIMKTDHIQSLFQSINTDPKTASVFGSAPKLLAGEKTLSLRISDIELQLSPDAFFQMNTAQAVNLYQMAVNKIDKCETLVEAYCGIGTMSLLAHKKAKHIYGIENVPAAVENANANAEKNEIKNVSFQCGDASEEFLKIADEKQVDCLLADPPRSGMDDKMIQAILQVKPKRIVYVSCNPATLAKNLNDLKHQYHVVTIIPYDMFPHTPLVESITVLERDNYKD